MPPSWCGPHVPEREPDERWRATNLLGTRTKLTGPVAGRATIVAVNRVPVRALRNQTAQVLSRVKAGEVLELTEHGRPVARIVPLTLERWENLRLLGEVESAEEDDGAEIVDIPPANGAEGVASASEILARLRAGER